VWNLGSGIPFKKGDMCPICGRPIDYIEKKVVKGNGTQHVYYYARHIIVDENGQKKVKKCYLGAETYDYVSRKNYDLGIVFMGLAVDPVTRLVEYINSAANKLSARIEGGALDLEQARSWLNALREATAKLQSLADALEKYVREHEGKEASA
jgi:hypothetical protein